MLVKGFLLKKQTFLKKNMAQSPNVKLRARLVKEI